MSVNRRNVRILGFTTELRMSIKSTVLNDNVMSINKD